MNWTRVAGPILGPTADWSRSHALLPTPIDRGDDIEVLAAALDGNDFGRPFSVTLSTGDFTVRRTRPTPMLDVGPPGSFDDSGVVPSCVVRNGGTLILYYLGFQRAERVPYMIFSGIATSTDDGESWQKQQVTPVLDRTPTEPYSRGAPFVIKTTKGFACFYWSCWGWTSDAGKIHYNNHIHRVDSSDPFTWDVPSRRVVSCMPGPEFSVGRPWVLHVDGVYHLWLSTRSLDRPYRMGYAISRDGVTFERHDKLVGISPSLSGWDSDMVCYSSLFTRGERVFMLFNGNGHGRTGFGVAELDGGFETLRRTAREVMGPA